MIKEQSKAGKKKKLILSRKNTFLVNSRKSEILLYNVHIVKQLLHTHN